MAGPVLLAHLNHLAKSARETGDNRSYVERAVPSLGIVNHGGKLDSGLKDKLSRRLTAAEDRYRDNLAPFLNETHVAAGFNVLRSRLAGILCEGRLKRPHQAQANPSDDNQRERRRAAIHGKPSIH